MQGFVTYEGRSCCQCVAAGPSDTRRRSHRACCDIGTDTHHCDWHIRRCLARGSNGLGETELGGHAVGRGGQAGRVSYVTLTWESRGGSRNSSRGRGSGPRKGKSIGISKLTSKKTAGETP